MPNIFEEVAFKYSAFECDGCLEYEVDLEVKSPKKMAKEVKKKGWTIEVRGKKGIGINILCPNCSRKARSERTEE